VSIPVVRVAGGPRERGRAVGAALAEPMSHSLSFYRRFLERRGVGPHRLAAILGPYETAARRTVPELLEEIEGTAEGADVPLVDLMAANCWEELEWVLDLVPTPDRCTAFAVTGPEGTILGHNEQWYAGDAGNVAVTVQRLDGELAFASPTVVTCLPAVGMNTAGLAQGVMSLSHRDDGEGVPRVPISRLSLQARDPEDHFRRVTVPGRSGGYAYVVAQAGGATRILETTSGSVAQLLGEAGHTNHYLAPPLAEEGFSSSGSISRLDRLRTLLGERTPQTPEDAMAILRDHHGQPQAICLHPDPAEGDEGTAVLFSMVCHLESRRMWVAVVNPCEAPYEEIDLPELREAA
jgi:isopenicillin-N N-acyltransferase like protein